MKCMLRFQPVQLIFRRLKIASSVISTATRVLFVQVVATKIEIFLLMQLSFVFVLEQVF